jgi:rare lipoprotein A (peptidoglycan hydrolase)
MFPRFLKALAAVVALTAAPSVPAEEAASEAKPDVPVTAPAADPESHSTAAVPTESVPIPSGDQGASKPSEPSGKLPAVPPPSAKPAVESGMASVYASDLEGRPTASGAPYDSNNLTAAHRSLPLGSRIRVTDSASGRSVSVTINDRWGGAPGQIVNLSRRAADELGMRGSGQRKVEIAVETLGEGRRQPTPAGYTSTPRLLPERIEATSNDAAGRGRACANEADILGLRDSLRESHVRNCLARKSKSGAAAAQAKPR